MICMGTVSSRFSSLKYHVGVAEDKLSHAQIPKPVPNIALLESKGSIASDASQCEVTLAVYGA